MDTTLTAATITDEETEVERRTARVLLGDCVTVLRGMEAGSIDAVVTDPPYGLASSVDTHAVLRAWCGGEAYHSTKPGFLGRCANTPGDDHV